MNRIRRAGFGLLIAAAAIFCFGNVALAERVIKEKRLDHAGDYAAGEILVKFNPGVSETAKTAKHARRRGKLLRKGHRNAFEVVGVEAGNEDALVQAYRADPDVLYAEPNYRVHAHLDPNDTFFSFQWNMPQVNVQPGWDVSTGTGTVVAVVDTGIRLDGSQDGFANALEPGYDFINGDDDPTDDEAHGTHVAGTVCQATDNNIGVTGVAFDCTLMAVKVLDDTGSGTVETVSNGIMFATDHGADVINLSLGRPPQFGPSATEQAAVQYAVNNGVVVVASSGNDGSRNGVGYPARYEEVIAVGAIRVDQRVPRYSNRGEGLDLVAPGGDSKDQNNDGYIDGVLQETFGSDGAWAYWFYIGTSMAAPHVSGAAALLIADGVGAGLTGADRVAAVRGVLESTAKDLGDAGYDLRYGWGLLDIEAALGSSPPPPDTTPPELSNVQATDVTENSATITWDTDEAASSQVDYYDPDATDDFTVADGALVTAHSVMLIGLSAATTYHYQATSSDGAGNSASSGNLTFTTAAGGGTDDVNIITVAFRLKNDQLKVDATSSAGDSVTMTVTSPSTGFNYGTMTFNQKKGVFKISVKGVPDPGDQVTVTSSGGGSATAAVTHK